MLEKNNERCVSLVYPRLAPDDFNQQFRPGMKIWVTLPTGRTAEIQLDNGQIVTVDVNHFTAAGTGTPPGSSYPPYNPPPYPHLSPIHHVHIRHSRILADNILVSRAYQE